MSHSNLAYALPEDDGDKDKDQDFTAELERYREQAATLIPKDELTLQQCAVFVAECKKAANRVEAARTALVEPHNKIVKDTNALYMPVRQAFQDLARAVDMRAGAFLAEQRRIAEEEQRRINAEAERKRLELERKAEEERKKAFEAAAAGDEQAAMKAEAKAEKIEARAATVAPVVVETVSSTIRLGNSTLSVKAPKKTWILPGWDKKKPLPVLAPAFKALVGDLDQLPANLRWLLQFCEVNPVLLNRDFKPHVPFPAPFAVVEEYGGSTLRNK